MKTPPSLSFRSLIIPLTCLGTAYVAAAPGTYDLYFYCAEQVNSYSDRCNALSEQLAGERFLIAGTRTVSTPRAGKDFTLVRFHKHGGQDQSFGVNGRVNTDFGRDEEALALAVRKYDPSLPEVVVAAGFTQFTTDRDFALACYDETTGALATTFNGNGKVITEFAGFDDVATGVAIQSDGKIVAAGWSESGGANGIDFALARYLPNGALDPEFDGDGRVTSHIPVPGDDSWATCVAIQADGKILVAGHGGGGSSGGATSVMIVARYHGLATTGTPGSLDNTFGNLGIQTVSFDEGATVAGMTMQADGKILLAGKGSFNSVLARLTTLGMPDPGFGVGGKVKIALDYNGHAFSSVAVDVAIQPDSKIVVTGQCVFSFSFPLFVTRFDRDGKIDKSFGRNGTNYFEWGSSADLLIDDGKIFVAGGGSSYAGYYFHVFRFLTAQGDLRVGHAAKGWIGNDIYRYIPAGQRRELVFRQRSGTKRIPVSIQNDGPVVDSFRVRARERGKDFRISYFEEKENVSATMRAGKYLSGPIAAGASKSITAFVRPRIWKDGGETDVSFYGSSIFNHWAYDSTGIRVASEISDDPDRSGGSRPPTPSPKVSGSSE